MDIFIVIAAFNEERMIGEVVKGVKKAGFGYVVVVDDGSTDRTGEVAKREGAVVLKHRFNLGQGAAIQTGLDFAKINNADIVVTYDADGQFNPKEIKRLIKPIIEGKTDVALGSRFLGETIDMPLIRKVLLKTAIVFTGIFSDIELTDTHNGFRAFNKKAIKKIQIKQNGMAHASEIIDQIVANKLKYKEIPVTIRYNDYSKKKGQKTIGAVKIFIDLLFEKLK